VARRKYREKEEKGGKDNGENVEEGEQRLSEQHCPNY